MLQGFYVMKAAEVSEIPEEEILVFCKIYRPAFRNAAGVMPTFLRNFSMK